MEERNLYLQRIQAQLDEWKTDLQILKAKAAAADAEARLTMSLHVQALERKLEEAQAKFAELSDTSEEKWDSVQRRAEAAWQSLKSGVREAAAKFRDQDASA